MMNVLKEEKVEASVIKTNLSFAFHYKNEKQNITCRLANKQNKLNNNFANFVFYLLLNGIPKFFNKATPSSSEFDVVIIEMSIPRI